MTEKQLEKKLVEAVKNRRGIAYKFTSPGRAGVPDRLAILPNNKIGFIEVKKPGKGKLRVNQKRELKRLTALGCKCYVLNDPNDIQSILCDINVGEFGDFPQWAYREKEFFMDKELKEKIIFYLKQLRTILDLNARTIKCFSMNEDDMDKESYDSITSDIDEINQIFLKLQEDDI